MTVKAAMTLTDNGDGTGTLHGPRIDIALLQALAARSDRTALKHIRSIWDVDLPTARLLLRAAREEVER